jgi:HK97 family phage prohead protease
MEEKEIRVLLFQPEIREGANGKKTIEGYAVKWQQLSNPIYGTFREQFEKGAFSQTLIDRASDIFATWQHDFGEVLGRSPNTLSVTEDEVGLRYVIDPPSWAERHIETIQRGDVRGSSFTFVATRVEYDWESDPNYVIRTVRQAQLFEVAPVTLPAYPQSTAGVRSEQDVAEYIKGEKARRQQEQIRMREHLERNRALRDISISR